MGKKERICEICGRSSKNGEVHFYNKFNQTLCGKHAAQKYRGKLLNISHYDINEYIIHDNYAEIILRDKNYNETAKAVIDIEDVDKCKQYKWFLSNVNRRYDSYVVAKDKKTRKNIFLHRYLMSYEGKLQVDHLDRNTLNNKKSNLRIVSVSENNSNRNFKNTTVYEGSYLARLTRDRIKYYFGSFKTEEEANNILNEARKTYLDNKELFHQKYKKFKVGT